MKNRKWFLTAAAIILCFSLCIILPIESSKSDFITDYIYTYITSAISVLIVMYSLMGKNFFKGLLFIFCSTIFSVICWFFFSPVKELSKPSSKFLEIVDTILSVFANFATIFIGTITGIIAGLIFLIINIWFFKDENRYELFVKRLLAYLLILFIVSILFNKSSDWIYEISQYFKQKS